MPASLSDVFEINYNVQEDDIDAMEHVNNLVYLKWSNKAAGAHTRAIGWGSERLREEVGAVFLVRSHKITYRRSAVLGDSVCVRTWLDSQTHVSATRRFEIRRISDGSLMADGESRWVFVKLADGKPTTVPEAIWQAFQAGRDDNMKKGEV